MTETFALQSPDVVAPFDYGIVDIPVADRLREQATLIKTLARSSNSSIVEIGRCLLAVRQNIDHGQFAHWVKAECRFTTRSATNYMRVAEFVGDGQGKSEMISDLKPTTIYRLAAKNTPPEIVESFLERRSGGEVVSDRQVIAVLKEVRHQRRQEERARKPKPLSKGQIARREKQRKEFEQDEARRRDDVYDAALSILAELGTEKTKFILDLMDRPGCHTFEVLNELKKQIGAVQ